MIASRYHELKLCSKG